MAAHLTEEEQIEALKRWWNDYGKTVTVAVVVAVGSFWGWNQYQDYKVKKAQESSVIFEKFVASTAAANDTAAVADYAEIQALVAQITEQNPDGLYANFAELYLAKAAVDKGQFDAAKTHLQNVVDTAANQTVHDLAQLRLARVLAAADDMEGAMALLKKPVSEPFISPYAEAKGDILTLQNLIEEARKAYQAALDSIDENAFMRRNLLQMKLDNTKIASDTPAISPSANPHAEPNPHAAPAKAEDA